MLTPGPTGASGKLTTAQIPETEFSLSGVALGWNGIGDLLDSVQYRAFVGAAVVKDGAEVAFGGIAGTKYGFAVLDQTMPTVWTYSPSRGASGSSTSGNLVFSFSETVQDGSSDSEEARAPETSWV